MKIVLIGATGVVGEEILKSAIQSEEIFKIITISRSQPDFRSPKLETILCENLSDEFFKSLNIKADIFISALGTTIKQAGSKARFEEIDYKINLDFAKKAIASNAECFAIISALGANKESFIFYNKIKGELEESLKALSFKRLIILRPSLLISDRKEERFLEKLSIKVFKIISSALPESLSQKIGTYPKNIAKTLLKELFSNNKGTKIIERFNKS